MSTQGMAVKTEGVVHLGREIAVKVIDADVHAAIDANGPNPLVEYVREPWRSLYYRKYVSEVEVNAALYSPPKNQFARTDALPESGATAGSDHKLLTRQLLGTAGVDYAVLIFIEPRPRMVNPELETAINSAFNQWMADTWLGEYNSHRRFRGSIRVSPHDPVGAVREIEHWAGHPFVAQIYMNQEVHAAFGQPQYEPILAAAAKHRLPIAMHVIRHVGMRNITPAGFPSYHIEIFPEWPLYAMGHIASLVFEGTFEKYPDLMVVPVETGCSWLGPFLWRLDRQWRALGGEVPYVKRRPSETVVDHVRLTTQPLDEPGDEKLRLMLDWLHADRTLLFASDYPHYDYDDPDWVRKRLPAEYRDRVMFKNALELYGLPETRPIDSIDMAAARVRRTDE
jgi:predicted TIM-barrel fold metal-dependent hydrolase